MNDFFRIFISRCLYFLLLVSYLYLVLTFSRIPFQFLSLVRPIAIPLSPFFSVSVFVPSISIYPFSRIPFLILSFATSPLFLSDSFFSVFLSYLYLRLSKTYRYRRRKLNRTKIDALRVAIFGCFPVRMQACKHETVYTVYYRRG